MELLSATSAAIATAVLISSSVAPEARANVAWAGMQYTHFIATDADSAAAIAGVKPGFPAKKVWQRHRAMDTASIRRAISLLAAADRDLRGESGLGEAVVMEVLVARLSRLRA